MVYSLKYWEPEFYEIEPGIEVPAKSRLELFSKAKSLYHNGYSVNLYENKKLITYYAHEFEFFRKGGTVDTPKIEFPNDVEYEKGGEVDLWVISEDDLTLINDVLSNDEYSTDDEIVQYISENTSVSNQLARKIVKQHRNKFRTNPRYHLTSDGVVEYEKGGEVDKKDRYWYTKLPLRFIHEGIFYTKEINGMFAGWVNPQQYELFHTTYDEKVKEANRPIFISMDEASKLIEDSKYKFDILYCTNYVNRKL